MASKRRHNWREGELLSFNEMFINGFMDKVLAAHSTPTFDGVEKTWPCFINVLSARQREAQQMEAQKVHEIIRAKREAMEQQHLDEEDKARAGVPDAFFAQVCKATIVFHLHDNSPAGAK